VLSNCDVTVKNALSLCVRFVPFSTSISRLRYHCRRRMCNLTVISSPRKSSNRPFWSTMRIVRSVMLRAMIGRKMICTGLSDILYPGGTLGENSCILCLLLPLLYAPAVTLNSTRIIIYIHYVDRHVRFATFAVYASTRIPAAIQCCWACQSLFCMHI